eukprot:SAG22_NODE_455_length_10287_cov_1276.978406_6_plen_736_part_00
MHCAAANRAAACTAAGGGHDSEAAAAGMSATCSRSPDGDHDGAGRPVPLGAALPVPARTEQGSSRVTGDANRRLNSYSRRGAARRPGGAGLLSPAELEADRLLLRRRHAAERAAAAADLEELAARYPASAAGGARRGREPIWSSDSDSDSRCDGDGDGRRNTDSRGDGGRRRSGARVAPAAESICAAAEEGLCSPDNEFAELDRLVLGQAAGEHSALSPAEREADRLLIRRAARRAASARRGPEGRRASGRRESIWSDSDGDSDREDGGHPPVPVPPPTRRDRSQLPSPRQQQQQQQQQHQHQHQHHHQQQQQQQHQHQHQHQQQHQHQHQHQHQQYQQYQHSPPHPAVPADSSPAWPPSDDRRLPMDEFAARQYQLQIEQQEAKQREDRMANQRLKRLEEERRREEERLERVELRRKKEAAARQKELNQHEAAALGRIAAAEAKMRVRFEEQGREQQRRAAAGVLPEEPEESLCELAVQQPEQAPNPEPETKPGPEPEPEPEVTEPAPEYTPRTPSPLPPRYQLQASVTWTVGSDAVTRARLRQALRGWAYTAKLQRRREFAGTKLAGTPEAVSASGATAEIVPEPESEPELKRSTSPSWPGSSHFRFRPRTPPTEPDATPRQPTGIDPSTLRTIRQHLQAASYGGRAGGGQDWEYLFHHLDPTDSGLIGIGKFCRVRTKALSFCCASTVLRSKTVPFRAVQPAAGHPSGGPDLARPTERRRAAGAVRRDRRFG